MAILSEKIEGKLINVTFESTNLREESYNTENEVLTITFNNGSIYDYNKVPWSKFTKFRMAESHGKHFNENIAKAHDYKKVK